LACASPAIATSSRFPDLFTVIRLSRLAVVHASFALFAVAIVARAAYVQVVQAPTWRAKATRQQMTATDVPAPRGPILDADGTVLVESRSLVRVAVAPRELSQATRTRVSAALRTLDVPQATVDKVGDTARKWVEVPGRFLMSDLRELAGLRGVYTEVVLERTPPPLVGLRGLVGHASPDGPGIDGVELTLDSLLRGVPGRTAAVRDVDGRTVRSPRLDRVPPRAGSAVVLTIRLGLQDIAERALADAVERTGSSGGDVVVLDPRTGDLLALASRRRDPAATTATALTEPIEPGSTLKPFVAAALLERGRVPLDRVFRTHNGVFSFAGRTVKDVHRAESMTFAEVIRHSSNIGMILAAEALTPQEHYEALRDFGFGTGTGLPFPSEASGFFRAPSRWSKQSKASLSMGYEITVTPVQLAAAYGAIANDGVLMQPQLIREIRAEDGSVLRRAAPRPVRRVISSETATVMRGLLRTVVDSGTGVRADLATYEVGGKSGTAQRTVNGRYVAGEYNANFVGLFPADDPQLVVLVKLDAPSGSSYYGGQVAAPVMRVVLEAALASSDAALDPARMRRKPASPLSPQVAARADSLRRVVTEAAGQLRSDGDVPIVLTLPASVAPRTAVVSERLVPDVRGLSTRQAIAQLHRAGFRVQVVEGGTGGATQPAAGTRLSSGEVVRWYRGS